MWDIRVSGWMRWWDFWELGSWRGEEGDSVASAAPALRPAAAWNPLMPQKARHEWGTRRL